MPPSETSLLICISSGYSASPFGYCAGYLPNDSQPQIYSLKLCSLMLVLGLWNIFPRFPCHWFPLRFSQMRSRERIGYLASYAVDLPFISAVVQRAAPCLLTVFYFKGLLLSFSSYASQFSPKPEHPLSLYTGAAQKFWRVNTPAGNPQPMTLAKYSILLAFLWTILGGIRDTSHKKNPLPVAYSQKPS